MQGVPVAFETLPRSARGTIGQPIVERLCIEPRGTDSAWLASLLARQTGQRCSIPALLGERERVRGKGSCGPADVTIDALVTRNRIRLLAGVADGALDYDVVADVTRIGDCAGETRL